MLTGTDESTGEVRHKRQTKTPTAEAASNLAVCEVPQTRPLVSRLSEGPLCVQPSCSAAFSEPWKRRLGCSRGVLGQDAIPIFLALPSGNAPVGTAGGQALDASTARPNSSSKSISSVRSLSANNTNSSEGARSSKVRRQSPCPMDKGPKSKQVQTAFISKRKCHPWHDGDDGCFGLACGKRLWLLVCANDGGNGKKNVAT